MVVLLRFIDKMVSGIKMEKLHNHYPNMSPDSANLNVQLLADRRVAIKFRSC
jgi:hypothetical protein